LQCTLQHTKIGEDGVVKGQLTRTAIRCNTHCNKLQHTLQHTATGEDCVVKETVEIHCNKLQHTLQHTATGEDGVVEETVETHCNKLQHTLQHTATGEDGVVEETVKILETCLRRDKGCFAVPGIGKDQYSATLASSIAGKCCV